MYSSSTGSIHIEYVQCYKSKEWDPDSDVSEIYSLMRDSELDADQYLDVFEDTGSERTKKVL